ncbi:MAG TPA: tetratricopeptide repeat protein [Planctomycetota bacterium]
MTDSAERPQQIGPYRILDTLGEGGMGTVYLAEQQEPVHLRVALKLIKLGMDSKAVVARFEQERQALAMMQHDGIAKVFNCGTSERGQPFFAMELVKGIPLTQFCEQNKLSLPQRLMLMQQVCAAVQHAHQKGVVHRDLKPGNVLVSDEGGKLQIKIIDFGLAKAMGKRLVEASLFTEAGQVVGTPEYMAPEQADPTNQDIDTRADIYSLGVMLYELLVGALPFPGHELRRAGMLEVQRILREVEPPKPSTKLKSSVAAAPEIAAARRMSTGALMRALEHDLNWVALKALEKDRNRRYETANALASDLQRFLDHEPLLAGPPSASYRLRKLVRRYRGQVLAATAVLLALIGGSVGTFVQYLRAEDKAADALEQKNIAEHHEKLATQRAEDNAKLAKEKSELAAAEEKAKEQAQRSAAEADQRVKELAQVIAFQEAQWAELDLEGMGVRLRRSLLESAKGNHRTDLEAGLAGVNFTSLALGMLRENLFDRSLAAVGKGFVEQPLLKARLLNSVAGTLKELGLSELAMAPQTEALEIRRRWLGGEHEDTLISINGMGLLLQQQGRLAEAEPLYREALEIRSRRLGDEHADTLISINNMGYLLKAQGRLTEAEPFFREALEKNRRLGDDHRGMLLAVTNMASLLQEQGKFLEAELLFREVLEKRRRIEGSNHRRTLVSVNNLGAVLQVQDRLVEAEPYLREAVDGLRRVLGDDHPDTVKAIANMGELLRRQGKFAEAEPFCREALERRRRILGGDHADTLGSLNNLGALLEQQGKLAESEPHYRAALEGFRRMLGVDNVRTLTAVNNLGLLLIALNRLSEAETLLREAVAKRRQILGGEHSSTLSSINNLAMLLQAQGRFGEAEPLYREALETSRRTLGAGHGGTLNLINNLGALLVARGEFEAAEPYYREALDTCREVFGDDHTSTLISINNMGGLLQEQGKLAEAEPFLREALEKFRQVVGDDHPSTMTAMNNVGHLLQRQGKLTEAEPYHREALERRRRRLGGDHVDTVITIFHLSSLLVGTGRHDEAVALLQPAEAAARAAFTGRVDRMAPLLRTLGKALAGAQPRQFALADAKLVEAHAICSKVRGPAHRETRECVQCLVDLHETWHAVEPGAGHDVKAAEWKAKVAAAQPADRR